MSAHFVIHFWMLSMPWKRFAIIWKEAAIILEPFCNDCCVTAGAMAPNFGDWQRSVQGPSRYILIIVLAACIFQVRRFIQLWKSCRRFLQLCWRWDCVEPTLHIACDGKEDQDAKRPHVCPKTVLTKRYWLSVIWSSCCTKYSNILNQIGFGWHSLDMLNS